MVESPEPPWYRRFGVVVLAANLVVVTVGCSAAFGAVSWPFTLAVVSDAACLLVLLLGSATIGLV